MGIEKEVTEIINECEADDLARELLERANLLTPLSREDRDMLARILENVSSDVPVYMALRIAFWLGCAWQNIEEEKL